MMLIRSPDVEGERLEGSKELLSWEVEEQCGRQDTTCY